MSTTAVCSLGRPAGFLHDVFSVARRGLLQARRDPETILPALLVPPFLFVINVGALAHVAERQASVDFKAFQLPVALIFAVTGISRAPAVAQDIQSGYFDRLCATPVRRSALLLGLMTADLVLLAILAGLVLVLGLVFGVGLATGPGGVGLFIALSAAWGLAFAGFPYALAFRTGNPAAVGNLTFLLFFPFAFLTTTFMPRAELSPWLSSTAAYNPVTYLLAGMRSLVTGPWAPGALGRAGVAVAATAAVSVSLALLALFARVQPR